MTTQDFARAGSGSFVTGIAYNDTNSNAFYSVGEGKGGIQVQLLSGASVLASTSTWSAGGFSLKTTSTGELTVKFSGGGLAQTVGANVAMGSVNSKVDLVNGNTIQSSVTAELIGSTANLRLLGINNIDGGGNAANNAITGNKGSNLLEGLGGNDVLRGGDGSDLLDGGAGADNLQGNTGNDYLQGLSGNDTLTGGVGNDTFVFLGVFGNDRITDFQDGADKIRFLQSGGDTFADLSISGNGSTSVTISYEGNSIVVAGASPITLTASDFEFLA
jgi:Ca2+-binding RTX toxin-like protein